MKVKLTSGEVVDLPVAEARALLETGRAEPVAVKLVDRAEKREA